MAIRAGFVGLGNIGRPMAQRLVKAGLETTVYDLAEAPVAALEQLGARAAPSPRELAAASDVIGVCVRDDADVRDVALGDDGLLAGAAPGSVIAIHSTVLPSTVREVAAAAAERDVGVVDACITGGAPGASQGTLVSMVGGDARHLERCRPALEAFSRKIIHTGPLGSGATVKLCNNLMTYLAWTSIQEARSLALAAGLPEDVLEEVTRESGNLTDPMCAFLGLHRAPDEVRASAGFQAALRGYVEVAEKDLASTLALARESGVSLPGTALCSQIIAEVYGRDGSARP